ncbi:hypothetical protein HNP46_004209 [Pseudomonas nitritireducens]|uniref:Uncharacterized protein n=1 Tax=Pseudomonas nitroreducens TaxID=46680 RepID=A0A7W7P1Y2_PSENT|nr:hypothetical protein [Pseudomonas nitritireducens]MBB4865328.1 hypothetical protein [Pseudomonas nitritireducens]
MPEACSGNKGQIQPAEQALRSRYALYRAGQNRIILLFALALGVGVLLLSKVGQNITVFDLGELVVSMALGAWVWRKIRLVPTKTHEEVSDDNSE